MFFDTTIYFKLMYNDYVICKHFSPTETKVDVSWKAWAAWNNCGYPCNSGSQSRSRVCDGTPKYGGINNCVGSTCKCYKWILGGARTWDTARAECRNDRTSWETGQV